MTNATRAVKIAGTDLGAVRHICAFFNSKEEEYRILLPFIKEGIDRGERACHIIDQGHGPEHRLRLGQANIDVDVAESKGQLEVRRWEDAYLRDGRFDQNRMLDLIEGVLNTGKDQGYALTRLVANMEWGLKDRPGVSDIVEYESRLNYVLPKYDDPVCCTYDLAKFGAGVVMDVLRTHPMVIIGGILQENPFYVPPDAFLEELKERRQRKLTA
jgi:hypothetical protein